MTHDDQSQRSLDFDEKEQDQLDDEFFAEAERLAELLLLLPSSANITARHIAHTPRLIMEICSVPKTVDGRIWSPFEQAKYVMHQITIASPWEKWEGSPGFKRVYSAKFNPALATFQGLGAPVAFQCIRCRDKFTLILLDGQVVDPETAHTVATRNRTLEVVWCDCEGAKNQALAIPGWVEMVKTSTERARLLAGAASSRRSASEVDHLLSGTRPRASHSAAARPSRRRR